MDYIAEVGYEIHLLYFYQIVHQIYSSNETYLFIFYLLFIYL